MINSLSIAFLFSSAALTYCTLFAFYTTAAMVNEYISIVLRVVRE